MERDIAVLIASSDNTEDVLRQVFPAMQKFWPDCPFPIYVGKNSETAVPLGCRGVFAPSADWQTELGQQLEQVPASHVLLLLDDFLVTAPVDTSSIREVADLALNRDYAYVRLKALERALLPSVVASARRNKNRELLEQISPRMPYYCGLQPAIWRVNHLRDCLLASSDIWSFEHLVSPSAHYAVRTNLLACIHVVERGRWLPAAARLFAEAGLPFDPGVRFGWPRRTQWRIWLGAAKFATFGYAGIRLRRLIGLPHGRTPRVRPISDCPHNRCNTAG
jgi:hypothetical protein